MRRFQLKLLWVFLLLLACFVFFVEFVADVGGGAPAIPKPIPTQAPAATPLIRDLPQPDSLLSDL